MTSINMTLLAAGVLGTDRCPAANLRAAIVSTTGAAQEAAVSRYTTFIDAEMALMDAAFGPALDTVAEQSALEAHAAAVAYATAAPLACAA